jgi:polysaccharide export outer membrane protein
MIKRQLAISFIVILATTACLAQVASNFSDQPPSSANQPKDAGKVTDNGNVFQQRYPRYKLELGDQFDVSFELSPEFNQTVTVQPDGFIALRGIGDVYVADQTIPELTQTLKHAYSKILKNPLISVVLKYFEKPYFIADGQVGKPGKYDLRGDTTLTQAIAMAGGFRDSAKHSQVLLFRRVDQNWLSAKIVNVKKMEKDGDLKEDPYLHPGDMLFVPKNRLSKIMPFLPRSSMGGVVRSY